MSPDQIQALQQLDLDINSIRAAMHWVLQSGQLHPGLDVAAAISRYWYLRALSAEGASWYDQFLARSADASEQVLARGLIASSATLVRVGRWEEAFDQAGRALQLLKDSDNPGLLGWANYQRGVASFDLIEIEETRHYLIEAQKHFKQSGSAIGLGLAVLIENVAWIRIDPEEALKRSIALTEQMEAANVPVGVAHSTEMVGIAALELGKLDVALERYRHALPIYEEIKVYACQAHCLHGVAVWLRRKGRQSEGAVVASGTQALRRSLSTVQAPYETLFDEQDEFEATMEVDYPEPVAQGRRMSRAEVVDYAMEGPPIKRLAGRHRPEFPTRRQNPRRLSDG